MKGLWLNIGSSSLQFPGFVNLDRVALPGVTVCDARLGLPFSTDSAEGVVVSHMLEHLHPFKEAPAFLREVKRVLKPGGVFRVAVPDLAKLVAAYREPGSAAALALAESQKYLGDSLGVTYEMMPPAFRLSVIAFGNNSGAPAYDGHQVCFDEAALKWLLVDVTGFERFSVCSGGASRSAELAAGYKDTGAAEEIVVEVSKPEVSK